MVYLESTSTDPYYNLAMEEYIFEKLDRSKSYFFLWQNSNTVVVGKYQNTAEEIHQKYVDAHGIRVARRLSGGGAVYHDKGNLNFTFVVDANGQSNFDFSVFVVPVIRVLKQLGIQAEFTGRNDITIQGKKISGNSQYIKDGRLLHHGCVMLDSNLTTVADVLKVKDSKFTSKSAKSVHSRVTTINEHAASPVSMDTFKQLLKAEIFRTNQMETMEISKEGMEEIERLRNEKYATWDWIYGQSPPYDMKQELKLPSGSVTVYLQAEHAHIKNIRFFGDFFGNGEISELEQAMQGLPLDATLEEKLEGLRIPWYLHGFSPHDISELLVY